jgi:dynein heavy chain
MLPDQTKPTGFDEFNRLIPEVLSVCTIQFKAVCDGIKADAARIMVEGAEVSLDPTCGAFITVRDKKALS